MTKFRYLILILLAAQTIAGAQTSINDYKYIIIPKQFEFQKSEDQYQLNSLTKFLFNKYGYTAFFEDESVPADLNQNRCLALKSDVKKVKGSFLKTKIQIDLKDCKGNVVMSSQIGDTKEKEYAKAYNLAIREAFQTYQFVDYKYVPNEAVIGNTTSQIDPISEAKNKEAQQEIERLKKEVEALKEKDNIEVAEAKQQPKTNANKTQNESVKVATKALEAVEAVEQVEDYTLYAQPISNGFQVVDTEPKKVMILLDTGVTDTYIVKGKDAVVYKKDGSWVYAENSGDNLKLKVINIKF